MIVIIDYGTGNLASVKNALNSIGAESKISSDPAEILAAERIIFPGVGSFGAMVKCLEQKGLGNAIQNAIAKQTPFLGICLGLQALFEQSEESPNAKGLGIFKGKVARFQKGKVPQVGWNKIQPAKSGLFEPDWFYFVNSYYAMPQDQSIISAQTDYFGEFASAIQCKNVVAVQFHPEKSGKAGLRFLDRWLKC